MSLSLHTSIFLSPPPPPPLSPPPPPPPARFLHHRHLRNISLAGYNVKPANMSNTVSNTADPTASRQPTGPSPAPSPMYAINTGASRSMISPSSCLADHPSPP